MATVVDALVVTLGLDASGFKKGAGETESRLLSMAKKTLVAVGAFKVLKDTITNFVSAGDEIGRFASLNGIAVEQVQSLDNAVKISGGNVGEMRGTLADLNKQMTGLYPVNPFAVIGVRATDAQGRIKPMTSLLTEVAGKMEGLGAAKQADIGKKLGLDQSTIVLLQKGQKEVAKLFEEQKQLGQLTKDDTKISRQMNEALARLKIAWNASGASIARVLTPALTFMSDKLMKLVLWMRKNSTFVTVFFGAIATIVTAVLVPSMYALAKATVLATWPFIAIGLAVAAVSAFIAVLVDDYQTWKEGGQSAFGDTWKIAEQAFDGMIAAGQKFIDFIMPLFEGLSTVVSGVMSYIVGLFTGDLGKMTDATSSMLEGFTAIWDNYKEYVFGIMDNILGFVSEKIGAVTGKFKEIGAFFGIGGGAGEATKPSAVNNTSQTSSNNSDVQIGAITVQTQATDAPGIAKDLGDAIRDNGLIVNQAEGGLF